MTQAGNVVRSRLVERLIDAAVHPIVLVVAAAGYGKSVALDAYVDVLGDRCVRFDVGLEHRTLAGFIRGLSDACGSPEGACDAVIVDGLDVVQGNAELVEFLVGLIERTKSQLRWILASRSTVGLPLGTWLARGECDLPVDADDLRFTLDEAADAAHEFGFVAEEDELADVLRFTEGWPVGVNVALRASLRSPDRQKLRGIVRDAARRFWEEQVRPGLDPDERALLAVAAVLPEIDTHVLDLAGFKHAKRTVDTLGARTSLIEEVSGNLYRCPELFVDFLRRQTELLGAAERQAIYSRAARALESAGNVESALDAYVTAGSQDDVLRLLENGGFDLLERGRGDAASRAIESLKETTRRNSPRILALRGVLQSLAGNPVRAEALLRRSLSRAQGDRDLVGFARLRLAPLIANYGSDVADILIPVADDPLQPVAIRAEALSLLATARAIIGEQAAARKAVASVEKLLIDIDHDSTRARVLQRVGVAAMYIGETDRARQALVQAADLANELNLYSIACRAWCALSNLMCHEYDDVMSQLWYAEKAAVAATKSGDALELQTALLQVAAAEMRRGNAEESAALEEQLVGIRSDPQRSHLLVAFKALRLAWEGRFGEAHRQLVPCWNRMHHEFDQLICGAQCALFLALDGRRESSVRLISEVTALAEKVQLSGLFRIRYVALALLLCVIAEIINERRANADRLVRKIRASEADPVILLAVRIAEEFVKADHVAQHQAEMRSALDRLASFGYADVARVLQAACIALESRPHRVKVTELTAAELTVLRLLGEGFSTKEIADRNGRSVNTVRAHVANVIGKLQCHGRSQALALARRLELIP